MPPLLAVDNIAVTLEVAGLLSGDGNQRVHPTPSAALIAAPCAFDQLVVGTPQQQGLTPDRALRAMLDDRGAIDPQVLRLFASTLGLFPVGSVVRLSNGAFAVVVAARSDSNDWTRPTVRLVDGGAIVDLAAEGEELRIVTGVRAADVELKVATFLFA